MNKMRKQYKTIIMDVAAVILFILLAAVYIFTGNNLATISGDVGDGYYSILSGNASIIMNGELPLWNPYQWGGFSNVGHIFGAFYPILWILYFIFWNAKTQMLSYMVIPVYSWIHISIASIGLYYVAKKIVKNPLLSWALACMGTFNGCMLNGHRWAYIFISFCWIPWFMIFLTQAFEKSGKEAFKHGVFAGIVLGLIGLSSTSHGLLFTGLVMFFLLVSYAVIQPKDAVRFLKKTVLIGMCGLGLAAVQFLPFIEFILQAYRAVPSESGIVDYTAFIEHIVPSTDLHELLGWHKGFSAIGMVLFLLAALSLFIKKEKSAAIVICAKILWIFTIFMMSGTIIIDLFYYIPGFNAIREQFLYAPFLAVSSTIMAADTIEALKEKMQGNEIWIHKIVYVVFTILYIISLLPQNNQEGAGEYIIKFILAGMIGVYILKNITIRIKATLLSGLFLFAAAGDFVIYRNTEDNRMINMNVKEAAKKTEYVNLEMKDFLNNLQLQTGEKVLAWGASPTHPSNIGSVVGMQDCLAYINPIWEKTMDIHTNMDLKKRSSLMNIRCILSSAENTEEFLEWFHLYLGSNPDRTYSMYASYDAEELSDVYVYDQTPLGTGWLVHNYELYDSKMKAEDVIGTINSESFDPANCVLVNEKTWDLSNQLEACGSVSETQLAEYHANSVKLSCRTDANAILVTSEYAYPGWNVYVDGKKAELLEVNYAFRGVYLPAGKHYVEFRFLPVSFLSGVFCFAVTVGVILLYVLGGFSWWKKRKKSR